MYTLVVKDEKELIKLVKEKGLAFYRLDSEDQINSIMSISPKRSIHEVLTSLGLRTHLDGFRYIKYILANNIDCYESITKVVYPLVAKDFNTTPSKVERAIRHSIESAIYDNDIKKLFSKIVGHFDINPTNQQFLTGLSEYLKEIDIIA